MGKLKLMTIIGTRPEIIRLSATIKCCDRYFEQILVHTGQNYDYTLNQVFFDDLGLRAPDYYLNAVGDDLGATIGNIIEKSYTVLDEVISSLNLDMEYEDLYDCVSTSNPEDTRILEVTVKADSPELAKRIVDRICTIVSKRIEDAMGFQQVNLYELGTTDPDPCNSTRMLTFAFAGVVAAVVTYVIFLIIFLLDDRIKTDDENLERYLGLSVLGNIPNADGKKSGKYGYYKTYAAYRTSAKQEVEDK